MQGSSIGLAAAFLAGVASFLSPCVLPLIPGYLSFLTGFTPSELGDESVGRWSVVVPSLLFVAGFSVVFVSLGASASVLGSFLSEYRQPLTRASGVLVFLLGFLMIGVVKVPWLYGEARFRLERARSFGRGAALVMGMAFAFGWTPCVGPILGSILALAGSTGDVGRGALLLLAYSLGLGAPFLATGLLFGRVRPLLGWLSRHSLIVNRVAGALLMALGALIFTGTLSRVAGWLLRSFPFLSAG
jgi:cytochrome c-type biogenesis protein